MPMYVGDSTNKAKEVKSLYVGDENNIARLVKYVYVGDENNKAKLVYNYDDRNYETPTWLSSKGVRYSKNTFPKPEVGNTDGYSDTFTSDFILRAGDTYSLSVTHSVTILDGESDSISVYVNLLAGDTVVKGIDLSFVGEKSANKTATISGIIDKELIGKPLKVAIFMEGAGSRNAVQKISDLSLIINNKYLIQ